MEMLPVISSGTKTWSTYKSWVPVARRPVTYQVSMIWTSDGDRKVRTISGPVSPIRGTSPSKIGVAAEIQPALGAPLLKGQRPVSR